jgi:hypothetical protein
MIVKVILLRKLFFKEKLLKTLQKKLEKTILQDEITMLFEKKGSAGK